MAFGATKAKEKTRFGRDNFREPVPAPCAADPRVPTRCQFESSRVPKNKKRNLLDQERYWIMVRAIFSLVPRAEPRMASFMQKPMGPTGQKTKHFAMMCLGGYCTRLEEEHWEVGMGM